MAVAALVVVVVAGAGAAKAEPLPKATQTMLDSLKLGPEFAVGIEREARMPAAWIAGAKREKYTRILGTWDANQFKRMTAPFRERFPFIELRYSRAGNADRTIKTLMALKAGRVIADVLVSLGNSWFHFKAMDAIADLRDLPNFKNLPKGMADPDGGWVGAKISFRCIAYNTKLVAKGDLPKTWDDLLTNPRWRGGKLGIPNRPNNWVLNLWGAKGEAWATNFMTKLFTELKPQLRKEGLNASLGLAIAGEFHAVIPASSNRARQYLKRGAPVGWHCPDPVPISISQMAMLKASPRPNATKVFLNWFLSREAQMAQYEANFAPPVHKDLQRVEFRNFAQETIGKTMAFRHPGLLVEVSPKMLRVWNRLWQRSTGIRYTTVKARILKVRRRGRKFDFKVGNDTHTVRISGRRTEIYIKGERNLRSAVKAGMDCEITYPGNGEEAKKVACR
ncbi:MAG: extracellular solute-binding protein [Alphaproteobacteria bacterium]